MWRSSLACAVMVGVGVRAVEVAVWKGEGREGAVWKGEVREGAVWKGAV